MLEKFQTLFGFRLGHLVFSASETLSKTLQGKDTSLQEALSAVNLAKSFYRRHRTHEHFDQLYSQTVEIAKNLKIGLPQLPRYRKAPARFDGGSQQHQYNSTVDYFRHQYFQVFDLLIRELEDRFDQKDLLPPVLALEGLILNAANGDDYSSSLSYIKTSCFNSDLDFDVLHRQLLLLQDVISQELPTVKHVTTVRTVCEALNSKETYKSLFSEVHSLLRLFLTIPITSATSERSFSTLRRVCTYLRSTMTEKRLNNCFLLHVHKELTDKCNLQELAKEFVKRNDERYKYFGVF